MFFFFFNDTATTEIYTLSLHDALPILLIVGLANGTLSVLFDICYQSYVPRLVPPDRLVGSNQRRSEEHTSELQSRQYLVCRLLLEKKKTNMLMHLLHDIDIVRSYH